MLHLNTGCEYKKGIYSSGLDRGRAGSLVMLWTKLLLHISSRDALTQSTRAGAGPSAPRFSNLPKPKLTGLHCMTARVYHGSRQCGGDPPEEPGPPTMDGRDYLTCIFFFWSHLTCILVGERRRLGRENWGELQPMMTRAETPAFFWAGLFCFFLVGWIQCCFVDWILSQPIWLNNFFFF